MTRIRSGQITSGSASDGYVLTADGLGNTGWEQVQSGSLANHDHSGNTGDGGQFDPTNLSSAGRDIGDILIADGADGIIWSINISNYINDHNHSMDDWSGGPFDAANLTSGSADDGYVLTADGSGGAIWEAVSPGGTPDASSVTYTPAVLTDWDSDADPGNADDALDQLAERVDDLETTPAGLPEDAEGYLYNDGDGNLSWEAVSGGSDAANISYIPAVTTDWDNNTDPGNIDDALDQLAERVDDIETGITGVLTISFSGSPGTEGVDQNRNTGGSYTTLAQRIRVLSPMLLDKVLWDIRIAGDYTLTVRESDDTTILSTTTGSGIGAGTADAVFDLSTDVQLNPGVYYLRMTSDGGAVGWSDYNVSTNQSFSFFDIYNPCLYDGVANNYRAPLKLVFYGPIYTSLSF